MRIQFLRKSSATLATLLIFSVITKGAAADETVAPAQPASPETAQQVPIISTPTEQVPPSEKASPVPASAPATAPEKAPDDKQTPQNVAIVPVPESQTPSMIPNQDKAPVADAQTTAQAPATPVAPVPESTAPKATDQPQTADPVVKIEPQASGEVASPASENALAVTKTEVQAQVTPAPKVPPAPEAQPVQPAAVKDPQQQESAPVPAITFTLQSEEQKRAYASGVALAHYMLDKIEEQKTLHITLNKDILLAGIADTFSGDVKMSDDDIKQTLSAFDEQVKLLTMAENNRRDEAGKKYITEFAKQDGVKKTSSGMYYLIKQKGTGDAVKNNDLVEVSYQGKLIDGTEVDNGHPGGANQRFRVSSMTPALSEAVKLIRKGGEVQIVIPGKLKTALGIHSSDVPEDAILIYDISLVDVSN